MLVPAPFSSPVQVNKPASLLTDPSIKKFIYPISRQDVCVLDVNTDFLCCFEQCEITLECNLHDLVSIKKGKVAAILYHTNKIELFSQHG